MEPERPQAPDPTPVLIGMAMWSTILTTEELCLLFAGASPFDIRPEALMAVYPED
jgi:hypothetical protein